MTFCEEKLKNPKNLLATSLLNRRDLWLSSSSLYSGDIVFYGMTTSQRYLDSKPAGKWTPCRKVPKPGVSRLFVHILFCFCFPLLKIYSSVRWHGVADTSCVREVPKPFWPPSWNSGQWGHRSWHLSIWQHRRWCSCSVCWMYCVTSSWILFFFKSILDLRSPPFKMRQTGKALMS